MAMTTNEFVAELDRLISAMATVREAIRAAVRLNDMLTPAVRVAIRQDVVSQVHTLAAQVAALDINA